MPVLIEDTEIPSFLRSKYYADLRENFQEGLDKLRKAVTAQPEPSDESRARGFRKARDLLGVMVSLLGAAGASALLGQNAFAAFPSVLYVVVVTVGGLTALVAIISRYSPYRRSAPVELVTHAVQGAYIEALEGSELNPLGLREAERG